MNLKFGGLILLMLFFSFCILIVLIFLNINPSPSIYFPEGTTYDFGTAQDGDTLNTTFLFENRGQKALEIKGLKKSCSCFNSTIDNKIIEPGQSSKVNVSYKLRTEKSRNEKNKEVSLGLMTNDPRNPFVVLNIKGEVRDFVSWFPKSLSFYFDKDISDKFQEIKLSTDTDQELVIEKLETSSDKILASCITQEENIICRISVNPDCPKGIWTEYVTLMTSIGSPKINFKVPVYLMIH
ncbi:MAG: DUF1573 domain-containing protein [Sedimentisphaerales bacterium]|nr:DUF1573 domain-containing protein [Sedimentisphaerales bacterium]